MSKLQELIQALKHIRDFEPDLARFNNREDGLRMWIQSMRRSADEALYNIEHDKHEGKSGDWGRLHRLVERGATLYIFQKKHGNSFTYLDIYVVHDEKLVWISGLVGKCNILPYSSKKEMCRTASANAVQEATTAISAALFNGDLTALRSEVMRTF
jgi:hypothetical protein